jgi:hypothetical protein
MLFSRFPERTMLRRLLPPLLLIVLLPLAGCAWGGGGSDEPEAVWGRRGLSDGRFQKPRAVAIDGDDNLYIVDMTARIQVFDREGKFLRAWQTPAFKNGRPSGLSFDRAGNLLVADTHYYRVLVYTPQGELLEDRAIGGEMGHGPGQFGFVTDAIEDSHGNYYVSEYGEYDRIQKFTHDGEFVLQWGGHGREPGQFVRPQNMVIDEQDRIWVVDACNHRVQVFDTEGELLKMWGESGSEPGQLYYPYDLVLDGRGHLYIVEYGNHRVQKFTLDGKSLGCWGASGRKPGQLFNPWALALDSQGKIHVIDSNNHRVQRIAF